ncbi:thrombospondin type-1 domain-containing protein 8 [Tachyglossus aculeatus]|uniref:thrombospondin type-1 domain-containing protein 8 n=1 Tax=Tachyglossus aculeatus TaxID=9261 RepID=UPI0018F70E39|nr:thrombospondin type-1 domain-containing protein 8 [Tachyglossus aculeatus]
MAALVGQLLILFLLPPACLPQDYHYYGDHSPRGYPWGREPEAKDVMFGPWGLWGCFCALGQQQRSRKMVETGMGPVFLDKDTFLQHLPCTHTDCPHCSRRHCGRRA